MSFFLLNSILSLQKKKDLEEKGLILDNFLFFFVLKAKEIYDNFLIIIFTSAVRIFFSMIPSAKTQVSLFFPGTPFLPPLFS